MTPRAFDLIFAPRRKCMLGLWCILNTKYRYTPAANRKLGGEFKARGAAS